SSRPSVKSVAWPIVCVSTSDSGPNGETKPRVTDSSGPHGRKTCSARMDSRSPSDFATSDEKRNSVRLRKNMQKPGLEIRDRGFVKNRDRPSRDPNFESRMTNPGFPTTHAHPPASHRLALRAKRNRTIADPP